MFSFNKDSGRYQSVIPPLEKEGNYSVKIYRYKNGIPTMISEGLLNIKENTAQKIEKYDNNKYIINYVFDHLAIDIYNYFNNYPNYNSFFVKT